MTLLIIYASLALGISFLCSIMEAVLLSVTPAYVKSQDEALRTTTWLRELNDDIDRPLAAILSLNTIVQWYLEDHLRTDQRITLLGEGDSTAGSSGALPRDRLATRML